MKIFRIALLGFAVLLMSGAIFILTIFLIRDDLSAFEAYFLAADTMNKPGVHVRYMGNTNLLVTDGTTSLLIDGWFTRPSTARLLLGKIEPDMEAITSGLIRGRIGNLAAVIPVHSHFDHAMDAPEVARRTGAILIGSESTANTGRGWELPEDQILVVTPGQPLHFGDFTVTLIASEHFEFPNSEMRAGALEDPAIIAPLVPPVRAMDYKMGGAYSVLVEHPLGSLLVQGSAGFVTGALDTARADVVFLGVGGIASQSERYQQDYWEQVVRVLRPTLVVPVHWDSLTDPLEDRPVMPNYLWSQLLGLQSAAGISYAISHAREDGIDAGLLPMWKDILLFGE